MGGQGGREGEVARAEGEEKREVGRVRGGQREQAAELGGASEGAGCAPPHSGIGQRYCAKRGAIAGAVAQRLEERAQRPHAPEEQVPEWRLGGRSHLARRDQVTMDKDVVAQAAGVATVGGGRWRATPPAAPRREGAAVKATRVWLIQRMDLGYLPPAGRGGDVVAWEDAG